MILRQHKRPRAVTYGKYAPVRGRLVSLSDAQISRFYTFLSVDEGKKQGCRCSPRYSANNFVRAALANSHVLEVRSCLFGRPFLVLYRNIAVLHVFFCGRGGVKLPASVMRHSANNFVRATLASSHIRKVRSCLFGRRRGPQNFGIAEFWGGLGVLHRNIAVLHVSSRGEERRLVAVLRAVPQIALSEPLSQTATCQKYVPVRSGRLFCFD